eukprot:94332_1
MNIARRLTRQAVLQSQRTNIATRTSYRCFSSPVAPANTFNMVARKTHGPIAYFREWEALVFQHAEWRVSTMCIWGPSLFGTIIMFYCIWNSAWRDPEVRLRPHKKGWHFPEKRLARAEKYRGGSFKWVNSSRVDFIRKVQRDGLGVAGFTEPGQNGYEELPIPKL